MTGPRIPGLEAAMAWRGEPTCSGLAANLIVLTEGDRPGRRRTLPRALAVVVALAALSPLFAADSHGPVRGTIPARIVRQNPSPSASRRPSRNPTQHQFGFA